MPRMPGAVWRPIPANVGPRRTIKVNACIFHVDAGNATTLFGWFSNPSANASSHFYVTKAGKIEQYMDTDYVAWTSRDGSRRSIGVETQGRDGEPWTAAQVEGCAKIAAWVHRTYGVPLRLMENSRSTTAGLGWHRLGIDGQFPALPSILAGRQQRGGGELWSGSRGKSCPGSDRIRQMPEVLKRAKALAGQGSTLGSSATTTTTSTTRYPIPTRALDLGDRGEDVKWVQDGLRRRYGYASKIVVDGSYGYATQAVVKEFQRRVGLEDDGRTGSLTVARMRREWGV